MTEKKKASETGPELKIKLIGFTPEQEKGFQEQLEKEFNE